MARLFTSDFESNNLATEGFVPFDSTPSIVTSIKHAGSYALECDPLESVRTDLSAGGVPVTYTRFWFYVHTLPDNAGDIARQEDVDAGTAISLRLQPDGILFAASDFGGDIATSSALSTGQWYRIELLVNATTPSSVHLEARLDGVTFAAANRNAGGEDPSTRYLYIGGDITGGDWATGKVYFDDIAINDDNFPDAPSISLTPQTASVQGVRIV